MKKTILMGLAALSTLMITSAAQASHAYRSMKCSSPTLELRYTGNYPTGAPDVIGHIGTDTSDISSLDVALNADSGEMFTKNEYSQADVLYRILSSKKLSGSKSVDDGFDHTETVELKTIVFTQISKNAKSRLGISKNQKMYFVCEETTDYPNGKTK